MLNWKKVGIGYKANGKRGLWIVCNYGIGWAVFLNSVQQPIVYDTLKAAMFYAETRE